MQSKILTDSLMFLGTDRLARYVLFLVRFRLGNCPKDDNSIFFFKSLVIYSIRAPNSPGFHFLRSRIKTWLIIRVGSISVLG